MTTPGSSFHGSPNESEDEQSNVDTDSGNALPLYKIIIYFFDR